MQLIRTLLSLALATLLATSAAVAQSGYSIQLSAYSTPATLKFFEALRQPVQQVKIDDKTYLYIIDGFVSYADADKVRKMAVGKGFPDAIALKTTSSRNPALKVKPYTGPADGGPVPDAAGAAPAQPQATVSTPPATPPGASKPTTPPATTPPAGNTQTYSSNNQAVPQNKPAETYSSGGARPVTPQTPPVQQPYSSNPGAAKPSATPAQAATPATTPPGKQTPTPTVANTPAQGKTPARTPAKAEDPYGNGKVYSYDLDPNVSATARGNTNTFGEPASSGASYDQNFPITETTVRALVSKGSVPQAKAGDLPQSAGVVFFDYNKALLRTSAEQEMARLATKLNNNVGYSLEIRAHTDAIGPDGYNDELSERRGKSAMIYMLRKGVPASRVAFRAFGETRPLADNTTPDGGDNAMGRQINRRVELVVKDAYGAVVETVTLP